jgi:formylglycine-generating enzyme
MTRLTLTSGILFTSTLLALAAVVASLGIYRTAPDSEAMAKASAPPHGMVLIPGGTAIVGSDDGLEWEQPVFEAEVEPFFLDRSPVTVAEFARFVDATGYVTDAEKFGDAGVMDFETGDWSLVTGAMWRHPRGAAHEPAPDDHPVTQVSWNDAMAYAQWAGKRLPTEVEWEYAARGGPERAETPYAWGRHLEVGGRYRANTWQGTFPGTNTGDDGFLLTSPVGHFGETSLGLTDMGGNVWEWTSDWFRDYSRRAQPVTSAEMQSKAQRGGSFLCHPSYCHGYRVSARSHSSPETSLFNVGFRCAKDIDT